LTLLKTDSRAPACAVSCLVYNFQVRDSTPQIDVVWIDYLCD